MSFGPDAVRLGNWRERAKIALVPGLLIAAVAVWVMIWLLHGYRFYFQDDAFISLRYVWNLLEHGELTWNLGERVEGYTNFFFIVLTAGMQLLGVNPIPSAQVINFAALAFLGVAFIPVARTMVSLDAALIGWALAMSSMPFLVWVWGGLEAPLFGALVFALHACVLLHFSGRGDRLWVSLAGLIAALAVLTRQDGAIFAIVACLAIFLGSGPLRRGFAKSLLFAAWGAPIVIGFLAFRYSYYGDLMPNTYYVKGSANLPAGLEYVFNFAAQPPFLPLLALGGAILGWRAGRRREVAFIGASAALYALYVAFVGGDHMAYSRLLVPLVPILAMLVSLGASEALRIVARPLVPIAAVSLLIILQFTLVTGKRWDQAAVMGTVVGQHIAEHWPSGSLIALNTAGSTPFYNLDKRFIDMLGLNDAVIARREVPEFRLRRQRWPGHNKGDGAYILSRRPDYIILAAADGRDATDPWFLSDIELVENPEFRECYTKHEIDMRYPFVDKHSELPYRRDEDLRGPRRIILLPLIYYKRMSKPQCGKAAGK